MMPYYPQSFYKQVSPSHLRFVRSFFLFDRPGQNLFKRPKRPAQMGFFLFFSQTTLNECSFVLNLRYGTIFPWWSAVCLRLASPNADLQLSPPFFPVFILKKS